MQYIALIGDIIHSKEIEERRQVQEGLKSCLAKINKKYRRVLASDFSLTLGDEFQALLHLEAPVFKIIDEINLAFSPHQIRFGLGLGEILTAIDPKQSIGADGPAYWRARTAIQRVHQRNDYGNTQLAAETASQEKSDQINALLAATEFIRSSWRSSQTAVLQTLLKLDIYQEQFEQGPVASKLGLNVSAFSKRLKSSGIKVYLRGRQSALNMLREIGSKETEEEPR